jgi:hypothetical protein
VLTLLLYALLALIAVSCLYGLATLFLARTEQISPPAADQAPWRLADAPLDAHDVVELRLPVALRGYRFAETDLLLDRLADELRERDEEIARLKAGPAPELGDAAAASAAGEIATGPSTAPDAASSTSAATAATDR